MGYLVNLIIYTFVLFITFLSLYIGMHELKPSHDRVGHGTGLICLGLFFTYFSPGKHTHVGALTPTPQILGAGWEYAVHKL